MAIEISLIDSIVELSLYACNNEYKETFTEIFHPYVTTPLTRLLLYVEFGKKYKIDDLITEFNNIKNINENTNYTSDIDQLKKIILLNLEKDSIWKICPTCNIEYETRIRKFENINYIMTNNNLCIFHSKNKI